MGEQLTPAEAQEALAAVARAQRQIAGEVGLPRVYWWAMAAAWVVLGVLNEVGPRGIGVVVTFLVGAGHSVFATRYLDGRRPTSGVQVSAAVAGGRTQVVVIGMLLMLVALTVAAALALDADGTGHPAIWAGVLVGVIVGFGGPEILRVLRRWAHA
ncbi:hypothetical protein [Nocardioides sp. Iso805N]|uniref:hypothetical protein n=1 Tax=Nocardioides sp. Iso805N TaxID=1283287 RepID=UPI0003672192|nr:hypothetical protein [Nocardioides sp. Iso805N]